MRILNIAFIICSTVPGDSFAPDRNNLNKKLIESTSFSAYKNFVEQNEDNFEEDTSKTYGPRAKGFDDLVDVKTAMNDFFSTNDSWSPLFRSIAIGADVPAMEYLGGAHGEDIQINDKSSPWTQLNATPANDDEKAVISMFLDSMQQSLLDITVDEQTNEDQNDLHFLEEGRRMLALTRFQVLANISGGSIEDYDKLFSVCWSEINELHKADISSSGSLILLPDYDISNLRRFTDMNLLKPLDWLGMTGLFEVASMERAVPAIRLLHKLQDIPTEENKPVRLLDL